MDRYVVREPRAATDYRTVAFRASTPRDNSGISTHENIYYGGYVQSSTECPAVRHEPINPPGYPMNPHFIGVQQCINTGNFPMNFHPGQGQMMSGIDPRYLAAYSDNAAPFIVTGSDYENRDLVAPDRSKLSTFTTAEQITKGKIYKQQKDNIIPPKAVTPIIKNNNTRQEHSGQDSVKSLAPISGSSNKISAENVLKEETQNQFVMRSDKLKTLYKSGPRVFSGPVEKILKWHKTLQEIGVLVIYELVAKCVSIRQGESSSKNLVVRDDNGPAMQVVYYEIDFLLPELKPPCTVRVVGRMMAGTSRLQAFNVRLATGDDVAMLPRRAAVAAHHVAKLCKEYGVNS